MITSIDLSSIGHLSPAFTDDDEASIRRVCEELQVGAVQVLNCPGFDFNYFAQQGGVELQRIRAFLGNNIDFSVIGYLAGRSMDAFHTPYSIFRHDIYAAFIQWRMGVEQATVAHHINAKHVLVYLKKLYDDILSGLPDGHKQMILKYHMLYAGCTKRPSPKRALAIVSFIKHIPLSALMLLTCSDAEGALLTQRILDLPWKRANFPEDVACKLMDGLMRLSMSKTYFHAIFQAYMEGLDASGEQVVAIAAFERKLSSEAGPFSDAGVASGNRCSAFALFSECRANDMVDGSQDDGTLGDIWGGLSQQMKEIYAAVATKIVAGHLLQDLKTQVDAQVQVQSSSFIIAPCTASTAILLSCILSLH